jgi:hypothetical protein
MDGIFRTVCAADDHIKPPVRSQGLVIDLVDNGLSCDGDELVAFPKAQSFGNRARLYMGDCGGHNPASFLMF